MVSLICALNQLLCLPAELLPALPSAWPNGSLNGLKARAGYAVDFAWVDGKLADAKINGAGKTTVRGGEKIVEICLKENETKHLSKSSFN